MNTKTILGLGLIGAGAIYYTRKARAIENIYVESATAKNVRISGGALTLDAVFKVTNTSNANLQINGVGGALYFGNSKGVLTQVGTAVQSQNYQIAKQQTTELILPIRIALSNLISIAQTVYQALVNKAGITGRFKGNVQAVGFNIPITSDLSIKLS